MLHLKNLSKEFGGRTLFNDISWHLKKGERVALVGENGAGKSTLMKIIAFEAEKRGSEIQFAKGADAGYLPQDGIVTKGITLFHAAKSGLAQLLDMEQELHHIAERLSDSSIPEKEHNEILERYGELQEIFRQRGGYAIESAVSTVLAGLGFSQSDYHKDCAHFSGGWQMRIALAKLLLAKPSILLLDEPTNHLDIEARNWLEEYLKNYEGSVILVSHDRFFMDQICSRIAEIWNCTITDYHCNYSTYLVQREERITSLIEAKRIQDEEIEKNEDFIRRFRYQANKASLVQSRIKQLEKVVRIIIPPERKKIRFQFPTPPKSGKIVMELNKISRLYGFNIVLSEVDMVVEKGERVALVGQNGAGKSTLMKIVAGGEFQSGERIVGHNVAIDYFAQDQASVLDSSKTVYQEIYSEAPFEMVPKLRDILGGFLFSGDDIEKPVAVLSGGERNRLALAKMLLRKSNLLLMDEPTNHLDLFSKEILLDALKRFEGTIIFVSHDRHFVNSLATRVVEVADTKLKSYYGDYEYYLSKKEGGDATSKESSNSVIPSENLKIEEQTREEKSDRKVGREEQKQKKREEQARVKLLSEIEGEITKYEDEVAALEADMNSEGFFDDPQRGIAAGERHSELNKIILELYQKWEELN